MPLPKSLMSLTVLVLAGTTVAAQAQDPSKRGRALLKEFCARCHAIGKIGKSPHAAAPAFRTLGNSFDLDHFARELQRGLMPGHPDMPVFKFNEADARAVSAYLRTIQK